MFYCKTSTNYNKWEVFESDESTDDDKEPIVPKDDPQFKAMEKDFDDRIQRRRRGKKLADELKNKGNEAMKRGLYKSARQHYTDASEHKKDYLQLYTNRALACLKLELFQEAIDDCTKVIEYCEVFTEKDSLDLRYKSLMRRGQALKYQKDFALAMHDFEEAMKLQTKGETDA